jgi:hypothetical protein
MSSSHLRLEGVSVRAATEADSGAILRLVNLIQPAIPWTPEHLRWQFFEPPFGPAQLQVIEDHADGIVALYAAVGQRLQCGQRILTARMVQDVMTAPAYRGRGFLNHLGGLCRAAMQERGEAGYTFPRVGSTSANSFKRNGWHELCRVPLRSKSLAGGHISDDVCEVVRPLSLGEQYDHRATSAWEGSGLRIGVARTSAFLNWRYAKPGVEYLRFHVGESGGFLILKPYFHGERRVVHLCDLVVPQEDRRLLTGVLSRCEAIARGLGAQEVTAWLVAGHPYAADFDAGGWTLSREQTHSIFVLPPKGLDSAFLDPAAWHISQGDSDVY